tara:strand:+ start:9042 stop:10319 length:1278 start_codon:yes stop_codon:yes gene_type:complete
MLLNSKLKELSFLVYGLGLSGQSVIKFFKKNKINHFKVWDDKNLNLLKRYRTNNLNRSLKEVDYIVLSPGISLIKNKKLKKYKKKIITDIDLFYLSKNKSKTIVVTGTNGKSTTCKLIEHLLKKNKIKCSVGGNIGKPILNLKVSKNSYVIIESSSFQLSHSQFILPDFAIFLNIADDHLDWHGNKNNYLNSKLKIFNLQTKKHFALLGIQLRKIFLKKKFLSKLVIPNNSEFKKVKNQINNPYLSTGINDENLNFTYTLAKLLGITKKTFINALKSFKGLPHRFEIFYKKKNITFINDSKATSFRATQSALSSLKNIYWILGGLPKKGDKINLSKYKNNITKCYLIGEKTKFFENQIQDKLTFSITKNLQKSIIQILKDIKLQKKNNKFILLSPAAASFDQFKNFEKRGEKFKRLCKIYGSKYI